MSALGSISGCIGSKLGNFWILRCSVFKLLTSCVAHKEKGEGNCLPELRMMTRSWMEVLPPATPCYPRSSWFLGEKRRVWRGSGNWTHEENKRFEDALAKFDTETPDRWVQVAASIPGKTPREVENHYLHLLDDVRQIEAGNIISPVDDCSFTLDWGSNYGFEGLKQAYCNGRKRSGTRALDQERKKGVPWTEEEHILFLLGLEKYGKGDWRNISRNYVITRTPTQVASHAQKYFIRLNSGGKDKRRASIHDIRTANLDNRAPSPSQPSANTAQPSSASASIWSSTHSPVADSDKHNEGTGIFSSSGGIVQPHIGASPYGLKLEAHPPQSDTQHGLDHNHNLLFQLQSSHHQHH